MADLGEVFRAAMKVPAFRAGGVGVYPGQLFIHVDTRPGRARWSVRRAGGPQETPLWQDDA